MRIRITMTGRHYEVAQSLPSEIELPDGADVDQALAAVSSLLPGGLPPSCLVVVSGSHVGNVKRHGCRALRPDDELTLIAPVAGG